MLDILDSCDQIIHDSKTNSQYIKEGGLEPGIQLFSTFWDIDERLRVMANLGIDRSIISIGNPWTNNIPREKSRNASRQINMEIASIVKMHPDKFAGIGVLPVNSPMDAVEELDYAVNELRLKGIIVGSRVSKKSIAAADFIAIFEESAKLDVPVYIHPTAPENASENYDVMSVLGLIYPMETSIAATKLVLSGLFDRFPEAKIILSHLGGAIPFLLGRLDRATEGSPESPKLKKEIRHYFKRFHLDTVSYFTSALEYAIDLWGSDKIMLGSDYPYKWGENRTRILEPVEKTKYTEGAKSQILGENAARLFKLDA